MKFGGVFLAVVAVFAISVPAAQGDRDVLILLDVSLWVSNNWNNNLYNTINQFLSSNRVSSYAFAASSFTSSNSFQFSYGDVNSIGQDFAQFNSLMNQGGITDQRLVGFTLSQLRSMGEDYQSRYVIILSDFNWNSQEYSFVLQSLQQYFQAAGIVSGRVLFEQISGGGSVRGEVSNLANSFPGSYTAAYSSVSGFTSGSLQNDWATLSGGGSNTPPPDINSPDHENKGCLQFADVVFVVDSSHSITSAGGGSTLYWLMQLDFINRIVELIEVAPAKIRVGIIVFGSSVVTELEISNNAAQQNNAYIFDKVKSLTFLGGTTFTSSAIQTATNMLNRDSRMGVTKIMFLISDGVPNSRPNTINAANIAKFEHDILITTVGVNLDFNGVGNPDSAYSVLLDVSTRSELFYFVDSFDNLLSQASSVHSTVFCRSVFCSILSNADILFVFTTNDQTSLNSQKLFAMDIISTIQVDEGSSLGSRIAIMTLGSQGQVVARLDRYISASAKTQLRQAIMGIQATTFDQVNNYVSALDVAYNSVFASNGQNGDRITARNLLILMANLEGQSNPQASADRLKDERDVTIFPIELYQSSSNTRLEAQLKAIESKEPIPGGITLYRGTAMGDIRSTVYSYLSAGCAVMEWSSIAGGIGMPGPKGDMGDQGQQGSPGFQGPKGNKGQFGIAGDKGQPGSNDGFGPKGDKGNIGFSGQKGNSGNPGGFGQKGDRGANGQNGGQGLNGAPGANGDQGFAGSAGAKGFKGFGSNGNPGLNGDPGNNGFQGNPGSPGQKGQPGGPGQKGESGAAGIGGFNGNPGANGNPGFSGSKGVKGAAGNPGSGLPGSQGIKGDRGFNGNPGSNGSPGFPGVNGDIGAAGFNGSPGQNGLRGFKGSPGLNGQPGTAGAKGNQGNPGFGQPGDNGQKGEGGQRGSPGFNGNPGSNGFPGTKGLVGDNGFPGSNGLPGGPGNPGANGVKGTAGSPGVAGDPGQGGAGSKGEKGFGGSPGGPGNPGSNGLPGNPGPMGLKGGRGGAGIQGGVGQPGSPGDNGLVGDRGVNGNPGINGIGVDGERGTPGGPGLPGTPGNDGFNGGPGSNGAMGQKGFVGTSGTPGSNGNPGSPGGPGAKGAIGQAGEKGVRGDQGVGESGDTGNAGFPGVKGRAGNPGGPGGKGLKGNSGNNGIPGGRGAKGVIGPGGDIGDNGFPGGNGLKGQSGVIGQIGFSGNPGGPGGPGVGGLQGATGLSGNPGNPGPQGDPGFGIPGARGDNGDPGAQGNPGRPGPSGSSFQDQCKINNGGCQHLCVSLFYSYYCACHPGYTLRQDLEAPSCPDIARPGFNGAGVELVAGGSGNNGEIDVFPTADVLFILDGTLETNVHVEIKQFLSELVDRLNILERNTYFAVIQYGRQATHVFTFLENNNGLSELQSAIRAVDNDRGSPANIATGLTYGLEFYNVESYGVRDTNKLAVVISAGNDQLRGLETRDAMQQYRQRGIPVVIFGVGAAFEETYARTLQALVVSVNDVSQLGTAYNPVVSTMRQALGIETSLTDPPTPPSACANKLDIAFVIDGSSSTTQQNKNRNFGFIRHFLENFVHNLGISYTGVRVSFVVFSNYASVRMTLDETWDLTQVAKVIKTLPYIGGDTNIAIGLKAAREVVFTAANGDRFDVNNLVVLVTDGHDNVDESDVTRETQLLKQTGVEIITIGVTEDAYMGELRTIATKDSYAIQVEQYSALQAAVSEIISLSCNTGGYFPRADIAIVIDVSDNVDTNAISSNMAVLYELLNSFEFGADADVRLGIVVYGRTVRIVQPLDTNVEAVIESVRSFNQPISGNEPNVEGAVDVLINDFFNEKHGDRLEAPNIALFFTSGGVSVSAFQASANKARTSAIGIVGIGISFDADVFFLSALAYRPSLAIQLNTYNNINQNTDMIGRAARIAVGMVHVPHWRPSIPRNQLCYDTGIHGVQCFCWNTRQSLNSTRCVNINECSHNNGGCSHMCMDTSGAYGCGCPEGMTIGLDKHTCEDVNECDNSPCHGNAQCLNTYGGYYCLNDGPFASGQLGAAAGVVGSASVNSLVGATVGTAVGTIILMLVVAVIVRTVRRKDTGPPANGHDNLGFRGNTNATMKASSGAFDTVSIGASTLADVDSLSSFTS